MPERKCLGWGEKDGVCENVAGSKWGPYWCQSCDEQRIAHLNRQFEAIDRTFRAEARDG